MRFLIAVLTICTFPVLLSACNTIQGAGQDIKAGGQAISDASVEVKNAN